MKTLLNVIGGILVLAGSVWFLQGINVLPGSFMSGDPQWAVNGSITTILGGGLMWWANRRK